MLDATLHLLGDGTPYAELTVQRITAAAGVSRSLFYVSFADRRELLLELLADALDPIYATLAEQRPTSGEALGPDRIGPTITLAISICRTAAPLFRATFEASTYDDTIRARLVAFAEPFIAAAATTIAAQQRAGRALPSDPRATAATLVWAVVDGGYRQVRDDTGISDATLVETLTTMALRTVYGEAPPTG